MIPPLQARSLSLISLFVRIRKLKLRVVAIVLLITIISDACDKRLSFSLSSNVFAVELQFAKRREKELGALGELLDE